MRRLTRLTIKTALLLVVFCISAQIASAGKCFTFFAECNYEVEGCEVWPGSCPGCTTGCCTYEYGTCNGENITGWSTTCFRTCD